jgi:general secretion pathway protein F
MPRFRYQATDDDGRTQTGEIAARDQNDARRQLIDRGLTVKHLADLEPAQLPTAPSRLTSSDAEELVAQIAEIGKANIPMSIGLRAAAAEASNRRIRRALTHLAEGTERGQSLEEVLTASTGSFPSHVAGLIAAATRTSQLGGALDELLEHHRKIRDMRRMVITSVSYPLLVVGAAAIVFLFIMLEIVPVFSTMFDEFGLQLPNATLALVQISDSCVAMTKGDQKWFLLGMCLMVVVALLLVRFVAGPAAWSRFLGTAPLFGPIVTWSGAAAFAQMMAVLLDYDIPLPRALELTSDAVRDCNVRAVCRVLAVDVANGQTLANGLEEGGLLPETLVPFVRSGEQQGDLSNALRLASQVFVERIGLRASLLSSISPPVIFVFVGLGIGFSVIALFMPLVALISGLS